MAYTFGADEAVEDAILRCAREQLDRAVSELSEGVQTDPARAVHNARKAIKKERSLLRLAPAAIPSEHERLLAPTCGRTVRGHAKELDRLADLLGGDHDLALLRQTLIRPSPPVAVDLEAVINLIDYRRAELQTDASRIGGRLYAEKPKAFRRRMRASWKAGRRLSRAALEQHPAQRAAATR